MEHSAAELVVVDPGCYVDRVEIARGGMGRISEAVDRRLGRTIALKELCVDQRETRVRLVREALLTARLSHPAIVSVHEAGQWPDGLPFYAMKLVPGRSLDRVIAERSTLAGRLALLPHILAVADALAYAHQQRVIHRDLKPHNVLVGEFGETVVIDWGLAKDLGAGERDEPSGSHRLPADPTATIDGDVLGTPAYMPPEQAAGEAVDERADVYAIGAMLYHLLAGEAPYGTLAGIAVVDRLQDEPPTPLVELQPDAPADLLAIVARAMARDADDRYATARGLSDDLRRFHAGQLVGAHHYSWRDLARRWLRRNRRSVGVAAVSFAMIAALGIVTLTGVIRAEHRAQDERSNAVRHRADAEELLEFMLGDLREKLQPLNQLGLLESVARKARSYFDQRPDDLDTDDLRKHALALLALGDVLVPTGRTADALVEYERGLELARGLVLLTPRNAAAHGVLAEAHTKVAEVIAARGDVQGAIRELRAGLATASYELPYLRDVAQTHARLGNALQRAGDPAEALREYRTDVALRQAVATTDLQNPTLRREIASAHMRVGNVLVMQGESAPALVEYTTALANAQFAVAAEPGNALFARELGTVHERIGGLLESQATPTEALAEHRTALAIRVRLAANDPTNMLLQRDLSVSHFHIADVLSNAGNDEAALPEFRADLEITERIAAKDPANLDTQRDLLVSHNRLAGTLLDQDQNAAALDAYRAALALAERIAGADPTNLMSQHDVATSHRRLADALAETGDPRAALVEYRIGLALAGTLVARAPTNVGWQRDLSLAHESIAKALLTLGNRPEALDQLRHGVDLAASVSARDPANTQWRRELLTSQDLLASVDHGVAAP